MFFRGVGLRAGLWLAGLCGGIGLGSLAIAQQPFAPAGGGVRNEGTSADVNVTVRVFDAATRLPLPSFALTPGKQDRDGTGFVWTENRRATGTNGYYALALAQDRRAPAVMIEADGYLPQRSGPLRGAETNLAFLLKKGSGPKGVVLTPDGQPAGGKTVYLPRFKELVYLTGADLTPKAEPATVRKTVTDAAGRFAFAPGLEDFAVVVADEAGFAQVRVEELQRSPEVRLQAWARLEGKLKIGADPGAHEAVRLADAFAPETYYPRSFPPYAISVETTTDAAGRFVFARVPPGDVKVFHAPKLGRGWAKLLPLTQITNLTLTPGEEREMTLGGQGRRVVGRVVVKNFDKPIDWQDHVFWMESVSPPPPDCPSFEAATNEFHRAWKAARNEAERNAAEDRYLAEEDRMARQMGAYYATPAGRQYWFSKRSYVLQFEADGTFRVDDVPGGKYELTMDARQMDSDRGQRKSPMIAMKQQIIEVPEEAGGRDDKPLDLGVIDMLAQLRPGDLAPDFEVQTMDGESVRLSDYKGKYVLLDFWATGNAASVAEMEELKETCADFAGDARFAMMGLNLDPDPAAARAFVHHNGIGWKQSLLGPRSGSAVAEWYGVEKAPFIFIIDTNGRVLMTGLKGGNIKPAVHVALTPRR